MWRMLVQDRASSKVTPYFEPSDEWDGMKSPLCIVPILHCPKQQWGVSLLLEIFFSPITACNACVIYCTTGNRHIKLLTNDSVIWQIVWYAKVMYSIWLVQYQKAHKTVHCPVCCNKIQKHFSFSTIWSPYLLTN